MKIIIVFLLVLMSHVANSQNWVQFGNGHPGSVGNFYLDSISNTLYSTGTFFGVTGDTLYGPAYFDGSSWVRIGNYPLPYSGYVITKYHDTLFVGGSFTKNIGAPAVIIMKWNGSDWDSLQFSPDFQVNTFCEYQGWLYIGGMFYSFGPLASRCVIKYSDGYWSTLPPNLELLANVHTLKEFSSNLIIAGNFALQNSSNLHIVSWDGFGYIPVDQGIEFGASFPEFIHRLAVYNNRLYIAGLGSFFAPGANVGGGNIISWGGNSNWNSVDNGTNNGIYALQVYNGELYACGLFDHAGGIPAQYIAKWDGTKWCSLGSIFDGNVTDMCVYNDTLIIAGDFTHIDGMPVSHMAKWIGGNFTDSCNVPLSIEESQWNNVQLNIYPNPANQILNISISSTLSKESTLAIYDALGEKIKEQKLFINSNQLELDISKLSRGVYFLNIKNENQLITKKIVKF